MHVVVPVEPLLLHRQPLELCRLGVHGLQLVGCGHLRRKTSWQVPWVRSTEDRVAQHLMLVWRLAQERVGDGAGRVGEARQVGSGCQGIYGQRVGPRAWRTYKTFTTTLVERVLLVEVEVGVDV